MIGGLQPPDSVASMLSALQGLPIEVRKLNFALVLRTTLSGLEKAVRALSPGTYVVSITLPTGTRIPQELPIGVDGSIDLPALVERFASTLGIHQGAAVQPLLADVVKARFFEFEGGRWRLLPRSDVAVRVDSVDDAVRVGVRERDRTALLQFLRPGHAALNVMLPQGAQLSVSAPAKEKVSSAVLFDVELGVKLVDAMLKIRSGGNLAEISVMASSLEKDEIDQYVARTPGASYAVVYLMLRAADLDLVSEAIQELTARRPSDPDSIILASELAARKGRHSEAVRGFVRARSAGLPLFSYGLNYVIDRLRFYLQFAGRPEHLRALEIDAEDLEAGRRALSITQAFGLFADFSQPLLTYTGLEPGDPDDELLKEEEVDQAESAVQLPLGKTQASEVNRPE